jgi:hypothetical protein
MTREIEPDRLHSEALGEGTASPGRGAAAGRIALTALSSSEREAAVTGFRQRVEDARRALSAGEAATVEYLTERQAPSH